MKRWIAVMVTVVGLTGASAFAQEVKQAPGRANVTIIPAGGVFFTEGKNNKGPSFGDYGLGGAFDVNFNRYVGVEAEVSGAIGVAQDLKLTGGVANLKTPNLLNYSGNVVLSAPAAYASITPYVTGGAGGLTVFDKASLGINSTETFLTGNVGGGLKWISGRWGLRADYRFIAVQSKDDAPSFIGNETRYGHRVYGGVLFNVVR
jgi:hypothetical protein